MAKFNVIITNQKIVDSYVTKFTQEELNDEEWKSLSNISLNNINSNRDKLLLQCNRIYVSTLGRVALLNNNHSSLILCNVRVNEFGYLFYSIYFKDFCRHYFVHRLVALLYIRNYELRKNNQINHIDENKVNNRKENLEWCDAEYNQNYGKRNFNLSLTNSKKSQGVDKGLKGRQIIIDNNKCKIRCVNLITNEIKNYNSIKEAAIDTNCDPSAVSKVCRGKNRSVKGYKFEYIGTGNKRGKHLQSTFIDEPIIRIDPNNKSAYKIYLSRDQIKCDEYKVGRIRECCDEKHHIAYGYIWKYLKNYNNELKKNNLHEIKIEIKIVQLDKNDNVIKEYDDPYQIKNDGYSLNSVIMCCDGKINAYKSFKWKYIE